MDVSAFSGLLELQQSFQLQVLKTLKATSVLRLLGGGGRGPASLQRLCERRVARTIVEPRTVLQVLQYADAAGAQVLRKHCMQVGRFPAA